MNQLEALENILDATVELDRIPQLKRARKVIAKMAGARRAKRERQRVPGVWPSGQKDCPHCGTAGDSYGCSVVSGQWVETLGCSAGHGRWDRHISAGEPVTVLAHKCTS